MITDLTMCLTPAATEELIQKHPETDSINQEHDLSHGNHPKKNCWTPEAWNQTSKFYTVPLEKMRNIPGMLVQQSFTLRTLAMEKDSNPWWS